MRIREFIKPIGPFPACPLNGIHQWLPKAAGHCRRSGLTASEAEQVINAHDGTLRRRLDRKQVAKAVAFVYNSTRDPSAKYDRQPALPEWNSTETARIHKDLGTTAQDLSDASPQQYLDLHPSEILKLLFPDPSGLLCVGFDKATFATAPLTEFEDLEKCQFIEPHYKTSVYGEKKDGSGKTMHATDNTGAPRWIVADFDSPPPEQHASIIAHLDGFRPLAMALSTGGKGLHAWFPSTASPDDDRLFWRLCIGLGADPRIQSNRSQFVRIPNGTRDTGKPQSLIYLNPENLLP